MRCPKCSFENESDAKFCIRCGCKIYVESPVTKIETTPQKQKRSFKKWYIFLLLFLIIISSLIGYLILSTYLSPSKTPTKTEKIQPLKETSNTLSKSKAPPAPEPKPVPSPPQSDEPKVVVPESVKGKWSAVMLIVENKKTKRSQEFRVNLNSEFLIPNSNLKVSVGEFLPDFRMDGLNITSASNEPNNPAVRIIVYEGNKETYKGWLYSKFPAIHPFEHPQYSLILKGGIPTKVSPRARESVSEKAQTPKKPAVTNNTQETIDRYLRLGNTFHEDGNYDKAIEMFERVLKIDPDNKEAKEGIEKAQLAKETEERLDLR